MRDRLGWYGVGGGARGAALISGRVCGRRSDDGRDFDHAVRREAALASAELAKLQDEMQGGPLTKMMNDAQRSAAISRIESNASAITEAMQKAQDRAEKASKEDAPARERMKKTMAEVTHTLATLRRREAIRTER